MFIKVFVKLYFASCFVFQMKLNQKNIVFFHTFVTEIYEIK